MDGGDSSSIVEWNASGEGEGVGSHLAQSGHVLWSNTVEWRWEKSIVGVLPWDDGTMNCSL
jgi:hypothetical protein